MKFFKSKELDCKSKAIATMYLCQAKSTLEKELELKERSGKNEDEVFTIKYDINCLANTIDFLSK